MRWTRGIQATADPERPGCSEAQHTHMYLICAHPLPVSHTAMSIQGPNEGHRGPTQSSQWGICAHLHAVAARAGPTTCHGVRDTQAAVHSPRPPVMHQVGAKPRDHRTRSAGLETGEACQRARLDPRAPEESTIKLEYVLPISRTWSWFVEACLQAVCVCVCGSVGEGRGGGGGVSPTIFWSKRGGCCHKSVPVGTSGCSHWFEKRIGYITCPKPQGDCVVTR